MAGQSSVESCHYCDLLRPGLFVYHAVLEFSELGAVPTACRTYEVAGDALELVDLGALAVRTFFEVLVCVLVSAVHAAVTVVVY